jgi:integrase
MIISDLRQLADENNNGYVFSLDGGESPVSRKLMYNKFHRALMNIGMSREEIGRRGLSMHSWRHFFNTTLQMANVALSKVQSVTGHKSDRMTEWYTHFDAKEFAEVRGVQESLLLPESPAGDRENQHNSLETVGG